MRPFDAEARCYVRPQEQVVRQSFVFVIEERVLRVFSRIVESQREGGC